MASPERANVTKPELVSAKSTKQFDTGLFESSQKKVDLIADAILDCHKIETL